MLLSLICNFPQSYYLYPNDYLDNFRDQRKYNIVYNRTLTSQCFPIDLLRYSNNFYYDSIQINYLTGINLKGIYIDEDFSYQIDIPVALHLRPSEYYGAVGLGYFHFGHEGGKTDEQKIVGFTPGFEIPLENFYVYYHNDRLKIELGRNRIFWGPGNFSSVFLAENLSYDMLRISYHGDRVHFENIITPLYSKNKKYLAAQRLEFSLFSGKILFGLNEAVVWSDRTGEYYLTPVSPYYLIQRYYGERPDNVLGGADVQLLLGNKYRFYIQGMVDDVSFTPPEPPEKLGFLLGIDVYNLANIDNLDLCFELSGVSPYTYAHYSYHLNEEINGFYRNDTCVGHQLGNNFWDGKFEISYRSESYHISSLFGYTEQGPHNLSDPWTFEHKPNPPWPYGNIEKKFYLIDEIRIKFRNISFDIEGQYVKYLNNFDGVNYKDKLLLEMNIFYLF